MRGFQGLSMNLPGRWTKFWLNMFREDGGFASLSLQDLTIQTAMLLIDDKSGKPYLQDLSLKFNSAKFAPLQGCVSTTPITPWHQFFLPYIVLRKPSTYVR